MIALDSRNECDLPSTLDRQLAQLEAEWHNNGGYGAYGVGPHGAGGVMFSQGNGAAGSSAAAPVLAMVEVALQEDTVEDVMYWVGQLSEAYPEITSKV